MTTLTLRKPLQLLVFAGVVFFGCDSSINEEAASNADGTAFQPVTSLQVDSPETIEGNIGSSSLSFSLSISTPPQASIDVSFVTVNGTATAGEDYEYQKGLVTFTPGETQKTIQIQILGDQIDEIDEDMFLKLASASNLTILTPIATAIIQDDDDPVGVSVGDASVIEGNAGVRKLLFPVTLSAPSGKTVSVDFSTADGLATTPGDYTQASGQLTFPPGITSRFVSIRVFGDTADEGDEDLFVNLQNELNATMLDSFALGTITNDDPVSGLQQRPANPSCVAPAKPTLNTSVDTLQVFAGVGTFIKPVALTQAPNDTTQWYLVEKPGSVYRFDNTESVTTRELFVDVSASVNSSFGEAGLLGIAFHPNYETNRYVYLTYTATGPDSTYPLTSRLSRFQSLDNGLTLDPATEVILMSLDQPYENHNGGNIVFGPDGFLYYGLGDGGSAYDPENRAQNTKNLFGTMARIDVDSGSPYGIPINNPFAGNPICDISTMGSNAIDPCPEIFAWGLRNPWRWSFDSSSGVFWLADVGQVKFEEVDIIERGGNYGWRIQEGFVCSIPPSDCDTSNLVQPILAYDRTVGRSITGGFVYRGTEIPELIGRYVFADYVFGNVFATTSQGDGSFDYELLADTSFFISSFGQDESGELYFLDYAGGTIHQITQFGGTSNDTIPAALSDTGCVDDFDVTLPASGLIPYDTNVTFWSDGAQKDRFYAIPDGVTVDVDIDGDWLFPVGTVLIKNFRLNGSLVETRHFMRHTNGEWGGYTYEWNGDETEATRVIGGKTKEISGQTWIFPSETQCMECHTNAANMSLGLEHLQSNRDFKYPSTGITANQLFTADAIEVLTDPLPDAPENLRSLAGLAAGGYVLDFNTLTTSSYSDQDLAANVSVEGNGATLVLIDNTWRQTDDTFNIAADAILEFDFESTLEGEVHGIGFDENDNSSDDIRIFKLYGTESTADIADFNNYTGSGVARYRIPVGQYYTGNAMKLVFVNDNDAGSGNDSRFSNIRVVSCLGCLDFDVVSTHLYADDVALGNVSVENNGATLVLTDNIWQQTNQAFNITADTILEFDFQSTVEGEIQGIGFDDDEVTSPDRTFKLYGTQDWGITDFDTYTGGAPAHYRISVGRYFTGSAMKLVFANDNDAGSGNDSRFSNVRVYSCPGCLDFDLVSTSSYADQGIVGSFSVEDIGATLVLTDNIWRKADLPFNITADTILEFDFQSTGIAEGEIHGIGFDDDDATSPDKTFKLYGTQDWGITDFETYTGIGLTHYRIPVGQYYTGSNMRPIFVNDNDAGSGNNSHFSNVRIHEVSSQSNGPASIQDQVRSYLHTNCSGCHRPLGPTPSSIDLRFDTTWPAMNVCDVVPLLGMLGVSDAKIIAPGDSARSILVNRMSRRDVHGMPPLGSAIVDAAGINLLTTWIDSLTACPQ